MGDKCKLCGLSFEGQSFGGPGICPHCDSGYPPVERQRDRITELEAENTALKAKLEKARGARKRVPFAIVGGEVRYLLDEDCDDPKARRIVFADELEAALKGEPQ